MNVERIMRPGFLIAAIVVGLGLSVQAQQPATSKYAGEEKREIKALSTEDIEAYQNGEGMGLAKAAELNQYPGPRHVLALAAELSLSEQQKAEAQKIYDRMHAVATRLGVLLVAKERELDQLFASKQMDSEKLRQDISEIAKTQGELRVAHLQAHLEMRQLLSPDQIKKYDGLRGYESGGQIDHSKHKHPEE